MKSASAKRFGLITGYLLFLFGLLYIVLLAAMFIFSEFPPVEPFLTFFNLLVLLSAIFVIFFWTSIYSALSLENRFFGLLSLLLMVVFSTLTSINRFVALTVVPQSIATGEVEGLNWFMPYKWPSIMLAMEILGWGLFFGLACLALAQVFSNKDSNKLLFYTLFITGLFSILAAVGQITESLILSMLGPIAWGPLFTITIILLIIWLKNDSELQVLTE